MKKIIMNHYDQIIRVTIILNINVMVTLSVEEYLNKIRPYERDIINDLKKSDTWKIQLTMAINFIFSKENNERRVMYSKNDNIKTFLIIKQTNLQKKIFKHFFAVIKLDRNNQ